MYELKYKKNVQISIMFEVLMFLMEQTMANNEYGSAVWKKAKEFKERLYEAYMP